MARTIITPDANEYPNSPWLKKAKDGNVFLGYYPTYSNITELYPTPSSLSVFYGVEGQIVDANGNLKPSSSSASSGSSSSG